MKLIVISSSSKANAAVVENNGDAVLIDCGVTLKTLNSVLAENRLCLADLRAVFVTHNHSDHVKGLEVLRRKADIPFYSAVDIDCCTRMNDGIEIEGFGVSPFACSHDVPCCGYKISCGEEKLCIATDTGVVTDGMLNVMCGCNTIMLESNHNTAMLKSGNYPAMLKKRILSDDGHLSNESCAKAVAFLSQNGLKRVVLAHLSEQNNSPLVARSDVYSYLKNAGISDIDIIVAKQGLTVEI